MCIFRNSQQIGFCQFSEFEQISKLMIQLLAQQFLAIHQYILQKTLISRDGSEIHRNTEKDYAFSLLNQFYDALKVKQIINYVVMLQIKYMRLLTRTFNKFSTDNFYHIANFSPELQQLRQLVKKFADQKIAPLAQKVDKEDKFPNHLWKEFGEMGLLGVTTQGKYGGSDLNYTAHSMIMEEISRASASIGLSYGAHTALCLGQISRHGTEAQKQKYLPKLCSGQHIGALAMSEPGAGSDVTSMKLHAEKKGNKYILNGSKMWITNGPDADVLVVYAKTNPELKDKGITAFIVEKGYKGFSIAQKLDKFGMRGSSTGELVFENVQVPEQNILGQLNKGVYVLMSGLDYQRLVLAAGPVGIMQNAFQLTQEYLKTRTQFGKPIGHFQIMQAKVAQMYTKLQASRAMLYSCSRVVDEGVLTNLDCASVIYFTSKCGTEVALEALQSFGGNGYINQYPLGRLVRDAKLYEIGAGTQEIRLWLMGRQLLK